MGFRLTYGDPGKTRRLNKQSQDRVSENNIIFFLHQTHLIQFQCFDAVGWVIGKTSDVSRSHQQSRKVFL